MVAEAQLVCPSCGRVSPLNGVPCRSDIGTHRSPDDYKSPATLPSAAAEPHSAQTAAALHHPNMVPVYECGGTTDFPFFIVTKFIDGVTVHEASSRESGGGLSLQLHGCATATF
jgi:hypothetical protein